MQSTTTKKKILGIVYLAEVIYDHEKETRVLALIYPATDPKNLAKQIGSIDFRKQLD